MGFKKKSWIFISLPLFFLLASCAGMNGPSRTETIRHEEEIDAKIKALQEQNEALTQQLNAIQTALKSVTEKVTSLNKQFVMESQHAALIRKPKPHHPKKKRAKNRHGTAVRLKAGMHNGKNPAKIAKKPEKTAIPPLKLYHEAYRKYADHKFHEAANTFLEFVKQYPKHPYANNALYWTGESYYSLGKYQKAATYFKEVIKKYPKGSKVPDALLKLGYTYAALNQKKVARDYLFKLMDQYPFSEAAQKAQAKLDELY